jgi:hypothetical protein
MNNKTSGYISHVKDKITQTEYTKNALRLLTDFFKDHKFKIFTAIGISAISISFFIKLYKRNKRNEKRKSYPIDIVILHQFPSGLRAPNLSSFAVKLETW